jgi:hypothetical protein
LQSSIRYIAFPCRNGGDEFIVLPIWSVAATTVARRIIERISEPPCTRQNGAARAFSSPTGPPVAEIVELAPAADAGAKMRVRFPPDTAAETDQFPLPFRSKSV